MQVGFVLIGLVLAAWGHAILHDWRGAALLWDRMESAFPDVIRSPPSLGGGMLLSTGSLLVLAPLLG